MDKVVRPKNTETTAYGAAALAGLAGLAGLAVGFWESTEQLAHGWKEERRFTPTIASAQRAALRKRWDKAVEMTKALGSD